LTQGHETQAHADTSSDIFKQDAFEFHRIAVSLFDCTQDDSTVGFTAQHSPGYAVEMRREAGSAGYAGADSVTGERVVSYSGMVVDIHPVQQ
jgi:hypothetical protein